MATIPFVLDRHTSAIYPLKLHEYLAAGRPVAATPLPSLRALSGELAGHLHLGDGPVGFLGAVEGALAARDHGREARLAIARQNAWPDRAADIGALIQKRLASLAPQATSIPEVSQR